MGQIQRILTGNAIVGAALDRYYGGGQAKILWVGNRSGLPAGNGESPDYPMSSLVGAGGALAALQGSTARGHVIFILPGSSFSVDAADWASLTGAASSFAIVGLGTGTARPTFTWTTATSSWLIDTANVTIDNCRFFLAGAHAAGSALTVAAPITVSAPNFTLRRMEIWAGFDADQIVTVGITTTAAADGLELDDVDMRGETAAECTTFMDLIGVDNMRMKDCHFIGATSSTTVGIVRFATTASLKMKVRGCVFQNQKAASIHAITGLAGITGSMWDCGFGILDNATLNGIGTSKGNLQLFRCYTVNDNGENGALTTTVSS